MRRERRRRCRRDLLEAGQSKITAMSREFLGNLRRQRRQAAERELQWIVRQDRGDSRGDRLEAVKDEGVARGACEGCRCLCRESLETAESESVPVSFRECSGHFQRDLRHAPERQIAAQLRQRPCRLVGKLLDTVERQTPPLDMLLVEGPDDLGGYLHQTVQRDRADGVAECRCILGREFGQSVERQRPAPAERLGNPRGKRPQAVERQRNLGKGQRRDAACEHSRALGRKSGQAVQRQGAAEQSQAPGLIGRQLGQAVERQPVPRLPVGQQGDDLLLGKRCQASEAGAVRGHFRSARVRTADRERICECRSRQHKRDDRKASTPHGLLRVVRPGQVQPTPPRGQVFPSAAHRPRSNVNPSGDECQTPVGAVVQPTNPSVKTDHRYCRSSPVRLPPSRHRQHGKLTLRAPSLHRQARFAPRPRRLGHEDPFCGGAEATIGGVVVRREKKEDWFHSVVGHSAGATSRITGGEHWPPSAVAQMDSRRTIARQDSPAARNKCFASIIAIVDAFAITGLFRWKCRRMSSRSKHSGTMTAHHAPITGRL